MGSSINNRVDPPIKIVWEFSYIGTRLGKNTYVDPLDDLEFDPTDLSTLERGHFYRVATDADEDNMYTVYSPLRCFDYETHALVRTLKSFNVIRPYTYTGSVRSRTNKIMPGHCGQFFRLNLTDLALFKEEGEKLGWTVVPGLVDLVELSAEVSTYLEDLRALAGQIGALRAKITDLRADVEPEVIDACAVGLATVSDARHKLCYQHDSNPDHVVDLPLTTQERAQVTALAQRATTTRSAVTAIDLSVLGQMLQDLRNMQATDVSSTAYLPLERELGRLRLRHPILRVVTADANGHITFDVGAGRITFDGSVYRCEGDLSELLTKRDTGRETRSASPLGRIDGIRALKKL